MGSQSDTSAQVPDLVAIAKRIEQKELSPVEVVEGALRRIEQANPTYNAYITVMAEQALSHSRVAESEIMSGRYRGVLHGVPVSVKDLYWTQGIRTTAGSRVMSGFVPDEDATVVARLKRAGAIIIAKANTYQFACSPPIEEFGPCRNPWDLTRTTRGSSSGSAAAVSAGLDFGSFGSDTGGSIRVPSAFTGIVGLKPSYGMVSRYRMHPVSWTLDHAGPMARTVADVQALLTSVIGKDRRDPATSGARLLHPRLGEFAGLRIGLLSEATQKPTTPEVANAILGAAKHFHEAGASVEPIGIPGFIDAALQAHRTIMWAENLHLHRAWYPSRREEYGAYLQHRFDAAEATTAKEYLDALEERTRWIGVMRDAMSTIDLLLLPASPFPATPLEQVGALNSDEQTIELSGLGWLNSPFNLTGQPAITLPIALSHDGLPIGVQLVGRTLEDLFLIRVARTLEESIGFRKYHPGPPPIG